EARDIGFGPISSLGEVMDSPQLKARSFFTQLDHPELGEKLTYSRPPFVATVTQPSISRRAPLVGEENEAVYVGELGFSREELVFFKQSGAI
ncbi:MAG: CoA transferase, partial [Chloroflexota bacterium]